MQSLGEENVLPDGEFSAETFTFEIIDCVVVEAFSYLKTDPDIFTNINRFKRRLSQLNGEKQRMLALLALADASRSPQQALSARRVYRSYLGSALHELMAAADQIQRSVCSISAIENPFQKK